MCSSLTNDRPAFCNLVSDGFIDDSLNIRCPGRLIIGCIGPESARDLGSHPVGDSACCGLSIDIRTRSEDDPYACFASSVVERLEVTERVKIYYAGCWICLKTFISRTIQLSQTKTAYQTPVEIDTDRVEPCRLDLLKDIRPQ